MSIELKINKLWNERGTPCQGESWFKEGARAMAKELCCEETKIVDLSIIVGSNIPMDFSNVAFKYGNNTPGFLTCIKDDGKYVRAIGGPVYDHCRFNTSRPVAWFGGDCPLPEGVMFKYWLRDGRYGSKARKANWKQLGYADDIIAFQVTGLALGYKYPWE